MRYDRFLVHITLTFMYHYVQVEGSICILYYFALIPRTRGRPQNAVRSFFASCNFHDARQFINGNRPDSYTCPISSRITSYYYTTPNVYPCTVYRVYTYITRLARSWIRWVFHVARDNIINYFLRRGSSPPPPPPSSRGARKMIFSFRRIRFTRTYIIQVYVCVCQPYNSRVHRVPLKIFF